jgi:hypothetical protein
MLLKDIGMTLLSYLLLNDTSRFIYDDAGLGFRLWRLTCGTFFSLSLPLRLRRIRLTLTYLSSRRIFRSFLPWLYQSDIAIPQPTGGELVIRPSRDAFIVKTEHASRMIDVFGYHFIPCLNLHCMQGLFPFCCSRLKHAWTRS